MAQVYSQTFESQTTGAEPSGITKVGTNNSYVVSETRPFAGTKGLRITQASSAHNWYYDSGSMPSSGDYEVELLVNADVSTTDRFGIIFRAHDDGGTKKGYFLAIRSGNTLRLGRLSGTTETAITTPSITAISTDTWYHLKVYANGSTIKAKIWADGASEPGTWNIDTTDTTYDNTKTGIGIYLFAGNASNLYYFDNLVANDFSSGDVTVNAGVQALTMSIPTPTVTAERNVTVSANVLAVTSSIPSPTISTQVNVTASAGVQSVTLSQPTPVVSTEVSVTVSANVLTLTGSLPAATISTVQNISVSVGVQTVTFSQPAASIAAQINETVIVGVQSMAFSQPVPTISTGVNVTVSANVLTLTSSLAAPTISVVQNVTVSPDAQVITISQPAPSISTGVDVIVNASVQALSSSIVIPTISAVRNVSVEVGAQVITVVLPSITVSCSTVVAVEVQELDFSVLSPVITAVKDAEVAADVLELDFAVLAVTVTADNNSSALSSRPTMLSQRGASLRLNQSAGRTTLTQGVSKTVLK